MAQAWGGELIPMEEADPRWDRFSGRQHAPFTHYNLAIAWDRKKIFYDPKEVNWVDVVHEMGHVFASKKRPRWSDEGRFFGFEIALARKVRGTMKDFVAGHAEYNFDKDAFDFVPCPFRGELKRFTPSERRLLFRWALKESRAHGLVDAYGNPVPIR